jgi:hypothetical protein
MAIKSLPIASVGYGPFVALAMLFVALPASADEPFKATERPVLNEPGEVTAVIDAFDGQDPFDLNLTVGYQHTWKNTKILRETYIRQGSLSTGGYTADTMNVAKYSSSTHRLNTRLDIGLYKDFALYVRMPVILSDKSKLDGVDGSDGVQDVVAAGAPGEQLFQLPFNSPTRSGIEYLAAGLDVNILNQARDATKPTWLFGLEGRFSIGTAMNACNPDSPSGQVSCAHPSDVNRNGLADSDLEGNKTGNQSAGVSRGTIGLEVHTMVSRRIKYVEPYGGFRALFEFPVGDSAYDQANYKGSLVSHPPLEGWLIAGLMVIPWENREQFQRVTFDARVEGAYRSEGQDYSELFDALGSSSAGSIRRPNYAAYHDNPDQSSKFSSPSVIDPSSEKVYFTGLTDVQAHTKLRLSGNATFQLGEYIKFQLGFAYMFVQPHFITMDQPCNSQTNSRPAIAGPCRTVSRSGDNVTYTSTGIPNPNYRPTINQVGRRFRVDTTSVVDLWLNGIVMF